MIRIFEGENRHSPRFLTMRLLPVCGLSLFIAFAIPAIGAGASGQAAPAPQVEPVHYRVSGSVYFGHKEKFSQPCTLSRKDVFEVIPAYRTIKEEGLDKSSARYYFLIERANRVFRAAVRAVAVKLGYDLVVERGGIKSSKGVRVPDITRAVIRKIREADTEELRDSR